MHTQDIFFVRRSTNRNEVHYAIHLRDADATPEGKQPMTGYWKMFEKGDNVTEPILLIEQMAFGISAQHVSEGKVYMKLAALPEREIRIENDAATSRYRAYMMIAGEEAELTDFFVQAEPGFLMPKVKYLDIHGVRHGERVSERINK